MIRIYYILIIQIYYSYLFQMLSAPSSQSITFKLIIFYILLIVDIIISSFIEASFNLTARADVTTSTTFIVYKL
jgi:hypothetical protein